jgi:hypothetical protein
VGVCRRTLVADGWDGLSRWLHGAGDGRVPGLRALRILNAFLARMTSDPMFVDVVLSALESTKTDATADLRSALGSSVDALKAKKRRQAKPYADGMIAPQGKAVAVTGATVKVPLRSGGFAVYATSEESASVGFV